MPSTSTCILGESMELSRLPSIGTVGWFEGPVGEKRLGIVLDMSTLQLYDKCRYGFLPSPTTECLQEWDLHETLAAYSFVEKLSEIYLQF